MILAVIAAHGFPPAAAQAIREYDLKAVFLFNFAQFVEWPEEAFPAEETPFVIGVLGDDPFGESLDATVAGETLNGRPFVVRRYRELDEIDTCHILFVSQSESSRIEQIAAALAERSILTVSDDASFARTGGMITLLTDNNRIRLQVNLEAANSGMLTISSKLLRPAEIVSTNRG
jgi:hypothetical protein